MKLKCFKCTWYPDRSPKGYLCPVCISFLDPYKEKK